MKRVFMVMMALAAAVAFAQQVAPAPRSRSGVTITPAPPPVTANVTERLIPITHSDLYCSGFMSKEKLSREKFVEGGSDTPNTVRYAARDHIFLRGTGYEPGTRVSIVRAAKDANNHVLFKGERGRAAAVGQPYSDLGYADIIEIRGTDTAVAKVEFSCEAILPGDLVVPFVLRPPVAYRLRTEIDRFPGDPPKAVAQIVMAKDFDHYFGSGTKVYLDHGANSELKPGDYFRVVRTYLPSEMDTADAGSFSATAVDDTQDRPPRLPRNKIKDLPRRVIGEVVILSVQPTSSVALITFALEQMHVGDKLEQETPAPPAAQPRGGN
jgi:hypothetical protein